MSRFVKAYRQRREIARTRKVLNAAIDHASGPGMRDELLLIAQRSNIYRG